MPVPLRTYAQEVQDLLEEYQQFSHGRIKVVKLDPKPDSDAEDSANLDGIEGQDVNLTDKIYLGIAVSCLDSKATIPYLSPDRETLLEYDLSRAISSVANPKKAVIGVMSALPVTGREASPMMMQAAPTTKPAVDFPDRTQGKLCRSAIFRMTTDKIDDDVSVLVVVHPQGISDQAQLLSTNFCFAEAKWWRCSIPTLLSRPRLPGHMEEPPDTIRHWLSCFPLGESNFPSRKCWRIPTFATQVQRENDVQSDPTILSVTSDGINKQDALGAAINDLLMPFAGAFTGKPAEGLKEDVLIKSSNQAGLVDRQFRWRLEPTRSQRDEERQYVVSDCDTIERKIQDRLSKR